MKKVLFFLFLISALNSEAQNVHEWEKLKMDSTEFVERFGSEFEYKSEEHFMEISRNKYRILLIGAKAAYINYFFLYLMQKGMDVSTEENTNNLTFKVTGFNNEQQYDIKMNGTCYFDKNQRITSVKITGTPQAIVDLFIDYWENYNFNFNELKSKKTIYTMNASDKVNFSWTGTNPVITITKGLMSFEFEKNK